MEENGEDSVSEDAARGEESGKEGVESEKLRIEAWLEAKERAPSVETRNELRASVIRAESVLTEAREKYAVACVEASAVYGYGAIAAEQEVSPKQLHTWQRKFCPDIVDLSKVPDQEMKREERRVAEIKKKLHREQELKEQLEKYEARMAELKEALHVK